MEWDETLRELLKAGSGKGSKMLSPFEALSLIKVGEAINLFLVSVEVYEFKDKLEVPRVDLSLYNVCNEEAISSLSVEDKKGACRDALHDLLKIIKGDEESYGFRVWLED